MYCAGQHTQLCCGPVLRSTSWCLLVKMATVIDKAHYSVSCRDAHVQLATIACVQSERVHGHNYCTSRVKNNWTLVHKLLYFGKYMVCVWLNVDC